MTDEKFMYRCYLCNREYQMGPHIYNGKYIPRYEMSVCMSCYDGNWDGWSPEYEEMIIAHLKEKGLPIPKRNEKGWLPRD